MLYFLSKKIKLDTMFHYLFLIGLISLFSSCASVGKYTPKPELGAGTSTELNIGQSVDVISTQMDSSDRNLNFKNIIVDYKRFSRSLARALKMELKHNGVALRPNPDRTLFVSINKVKMSQPSMTFRANIEASVITGDDQEFFFKSTRASYASPFNKNTFPTKPLDAAFREMVKKILTDKRILDYLR